VVDVDLDQCVRAVGGRPNLTACRGECTCADEVKGLVARLKRLGVDGGNVNLIEADGKIEDMIARAAGEAAFGNTVEHEGVVIGAASQQVSAETAGQMIVANATIERVFATTSNQRIDAVEPLQHIGEVVAR
jgi:hypothetical protein